MLKQETERKACPRHTRNRPFAKALQACCDVGGLSCTSTSTTGEPSLISTVPLLESCRPAVEVGTVAISIIGCHVSSRARTTWTRYWEEGRERKLGLHYGLRLFSIANRYMQRASTVSFTNCTIAYALTMTMHFDGYYVGEYGPGNCKPELRQHVNIIIATHMYRNSSRPSNVFSESCTIFFLTVTWHVQYSNLLTISSNRRNGSGGRGGLKRKAREKSILLGERRYCRLSILMPFATVVWFRWSGWWVLVNWRTLRPKNITSSYAGMMTWLCPTLLQILAGQVAHIFSWGTTLTHHKVVQSAG